MPFQQQINNRTCKFRRFLSVIILFLILLKITLSLSLKLFSENKVVKFIEFLTLNIKLINPVQKYLHTIES